MYDQAVIGALIVVFIAVMICAQVFDPAVNRVYYAITVPLIIAVALATGIAFSGWTALGIVALYSVISLRFSDYVMQTPQRRKHRRDHTSKELP